MTDVADDLAATTAGVYAGGEEFLNVYLMLMVVWDLLLMLIVGGIHVCCFGN